MTTNNEPQSGHQFISSINLYELETKNKIYLDLHFQSPERWSDVQRRAYIKSVLKGSTPTPIVLAHVKSCMDYCERKLGKDSEDYIYYKKLHKNGYEYISVDGNNRTKGNRRFIDGEFALSNVLHKIPHIQYDNYKNWVPKKGNRKYSTLPQYIRDYFNTCQIIIFVIKDATCEDLHEAFQSINSGITLNPQEWRNAIICHLSSIVRKIGVDYSDFFDKYWSETKQYRRSHEEWIVTSFVHVTRSGNIGKKERDAAYDNGMEEYEKEKRVRDIIKIMQRLCTTYDKDKILKSEATLTDLFMLIDWLLQNNYKINNERKFFQWFVRTYQKAKNAKITIKDDNGKTKQVSVILYQDDKGNNVRDYVGTQRSTDLVMREARLSVYLAFGTRHDKYGDILPKLDEDVLIQKDPKRNFPVSYRFPLWEKQGGKCAITGIDISFEDIFNGKKYVIDHITPHAAGIEAGGTTTFENAQLVCYDENKNKSDHIPNVTL